MRLWLYDYHTEDALDLDKIDARLDRCVEAGVTDVIVAAWYWGGPMFEDRREELIRYAGEARARGLRVHAYWVVCMRLNDDESFRWPGVSRRFYSAHDPAFRAWWLSRFDDFLSEFSVRFDGVSLDFLRTGGAPDDDTVYGPLFTNVTGHDLQTAYRLTFLGAYESELGFVQRRMMELYGIDIRETLSEYSVTSMQEAIDRFVLWSREPIEDLARGVRERYSGELSCYGPAHYFEYDQGRDLNLLRQQQLIDTTLPIVENLSTKQMHDSRCGRRQPKRGRDLVAPDATSAVPVMRLYNNTTEQLPKPDAAVVAQLATLRATFNGDACLYPYSNRVSTFLTAELASKIRASLDAISVP